jgi:hypothetical protein
MVIRLSINAVFVEREGDRRLLGGRWSGERVE